MPQFTQWTVPDPSPNILYNPMAVDKAIADNQSTLGNLDINRQTLALAQQKLDAIRAGNSVWADGDTTGTTGTTGAGVGPLPDAAPDQTRDAAGQASYNFWVGKGLAPHMAAGMAAQEVAESGGRPGVTGDDGQAIGLYQHHADRRALIQANTGIDMTKPDANAQREGAYWELMNSEHGARQLLFASKDADQAGRAATEFERPDSKRRAIIDAERGRDARRIFQLANPNGAASVATATVDPRAGPRAGLAPPPSAVATTPTTPTTPPGVNPNAGPRVPPATTNGQADDPNMAAVKQAATALLAMPEPEAAVAYGPTVRSLQAQGFALNAPPTYPGHAALQSLVGGGDAVAQTKTAMRLGGTDVAGPPGVVPTAAPAAPQPNVILDASGNPLQAPPPAPNRMMAGVGLPGVTIGLPGNGLAPQQQAATAAPVTTAAAPTAAPAPAQGKPPVPVPPPAPSRAIDLAPTIQGGRFDGLTPNQAKEIQSMALSLVPTQEITARIETMRQQNTALKQTAITNLAAQQQAEFDRRKYYNEQLEKTGWEQQPDGSVRNRYTGDVKFPPAGRFGPPVVGPDGKVVIPVEGGAAGEKFFPAPNVPAGASYAIAVKDLDEDRGKISEIAAEGRASQMDSIRVQEMRNILNNAANDTGPGTETKAQLSAYIQRWAPAALTNWTRDSANLTGPAAIEMFQKLGFMGATAQEQTSSPRGGYQATKLFQQFNPGAQLLTSSNQGLLAQRLIANQANTDYSQGAQDFYTKQTDRLKSPEHDYDNLAHFDQQWQKQRNPQVYAAAIGALGGQPVEQWADGLSDAEYKRALDVVSRADPGAVVNGKTGRLSMRPGGQAATPSPAATQPQAGQGQAPSPAAAPAPAVGAVQGGYRFKGGNPASPASWEAVH